MTAPLLPPVADAPAWDALRVPDAVYAAAVAAVGARHGFDVVRRISGGGAMLMAADAIVTYSLYVPASLVAGLTFADSYAFLDDWVLQALRSLGIEATYQPLNDIASPTGKIGGAAQKRLGSGGVLHHVTMSYDIDAEKMVQVLGVDVEQLRMLSIVLVALLTGAAVAFAGIISFVGLVIPHLIRMIVGPAHLGLLVSSALGGAVLLTASDLLARTVVVGADLPIGLLTSLIGGPFFFFLLYRQRRRSGGWA